MKKLLTMAFGLAIASSTAFGQLPNGSIAPNWTLPDINGNTHNLYTILAQGKTVFITAGMTWEQFSWNYHTSGVFEQLNQDHGPNGMLDTMCEVFFIETDFGTNLADLQGAGSNTQGDWITGTSYYIINDTATMAPWANLYAIAYFPTIYMVCPNQRVYELPQLGYNNLVASMNTCPYPLDALPTMATPIYCSTSVSPEFTLKNNGMSALTSVTITYDIDGGLPQTYNWSGSLGVSQSTVVTLPMQTVFAGSHTLTVTTSSPNGGIDDNANNDMDSYEFSVVPAATAFAPYTQTFGAIGFPYANWGVQNPDGDIGWVRVTNPNPCMEYDCYNYMDIGQQDAFVMEPLDMTLVTSAALSFSVAHAQYNPFYIDGLAVLVSTNCGVSWTTIWSKSGSTLATAANTTNAFVPQANEWRTEMVSLAPYVGSTQLFIKFVATNGYGNNIYVDNIDVTTATDASEIGLDQNAMSIYPNPANDAATVSLVLDEQTGVLIHVYDMTGALVLSQNEGSVAAGIHAINLPTAELARGMYTLELMLGEKRAVIKFVVDR